MDGILVQDSDWSRKLSSALYDLLKQKVLCDLGIVCSAQNDVTNIKSNEVVMVHRCVLSAASETIKRLSVGGQVYNLVKINGINISIECWNSVLEFVYSGRTSVKGSQLCDIRKAAHVLQIKELERGVDTHHSGHPLCVCPNRDPIVNSISLASASTMYVISCDKWISQLFENMLDLLVKQTLCNMTIITEKADKTSSEILAHLCMLVAASNTIRELVLQGSETYNSVKIDSIAYNTWLYLLEYVYTSRVSIVKSNIPEVWVASQLLQIDGLANAVSPFASQITGAQNGALLPTLHQLPSTSLPPVSTIESPESTSSISEKDVGALVKSISQNSEKSHNDCPVMTTQDLLNIKSELVQAESSHNMDNDENSIGLSLNSDSCDLPNLQNANSLNAISSLGISSSDALNTDQSVSEASLNDDHSVLGDIKSELSADLPALNSDTHVALAGSSATLPSVPLSTATALPGSTAQALLGGALPAANLLQNAQLIPVQTAAGGLVQTAQQLGCIGQWLQTTGLDGTTPTMLWLPQGVIPVVATTQTPTGPALVSSVLNTAATSPVKAISIPNSTTPEQKLSSPECTSTVKSEMGTSAEKTLLCFCRKCEKVFSQTSYREKHKCTGVLQSEAVSTTARSVRGGLASVDTNKLQCKHCSKIFSRTWTLNVHLRTHTGERPYKCNVCHKAFSDKSNMRQHTLIHTQNKQYRCPNCGQAFAQKRYMKKHFVETCRRKGADPDTMSAKNVLGVDVQVNTTSLTHGKDKSPNTNSMVIYLEKPYAIDTSLVKTENMSSSPPDVGTSTGELTKWDTSVMMAGDDVTLSNDEDSESEHAPFEAEELEDPLACGLCKRHFKTERQKNSHRCLNI